MEVRSTMAAETATTAPLHIARLTLAVRDLEAVARFYETVIGLRRFSTEKSRVTLGAGTTPLLVLEHRPAAERDPVREPGLFHTAFLMPTREDLGRWLQNVVDKRVALTGASDHTVSEAIYLDDPEGNGIEVYSDRPRSEWRRENDEYVMATDRLDTGSLLKAGQQIGGALHQAPDDLRIGHIHLRVNDVDKAEAFYRDVLGFETTHRRQGARWLGSGGYHHHIAANTWRSARSGSRRPDTNGLVDFTIEAKTPEAFQSVKERLAGRGLIQGETGHSLSTLDSSGIPLAIAAPG
jgi:catechol 2,3-dioxygenase